MEKKNKYYSRKLIIEKLLKKEQIKERLEFLWDESNRIKEEIDTLRNHCKHESYRIGVFSWRIGNYSLSRLCEFCNQNIGAASQTEIEHYRRTDSNPFNL